MGIITKTIDLTLLNPPEITVGSGIDWVGSTNSYYNYDNSWTGGLSSTSDLTVSFWIKPDFAASETGYIISTSLNPTTNTRQYIRVESNSSTQLRFLIRHTTNGASDGISYASSYGSITNGAWNHVLYSFDYSANDLDVFINDTDQSASNSENGTNTFPGDSRETYIAVQENSSGNIDPYDGCLTEFWMDDTYYDLSVESNRRKFISDNSKPVRLPASPLIYLNGGTETDWNNDGTYSLGAENYNLARFACSTSPSD